MGNTTHNDAENAELRARVDRLEALVHILGDRVAMHHNPISDPHPKYPDIDSQLHGEFEAITNGHTLTRVWDGDKVATEQDGTPWSAGCPCGWSVSCMTEDEAVRQATWHEQKAHHLEHHAFADLLGTGPEIDRTEDRAKGEAA